MVEGELMLKSLELNSVKRLWLSVFTLAAAGRNKDLGGAKPTWLEVNLGDTKMK